MRQALDRLESEGWLDDLSAARSLVLGKMGRYGRDRLERELAARGFSRETSSAALGELDPEGEQGALARAFEKLWRQTHGVAPARRRARVWNALVRRGFPTASISAMIKRSGKDPHEVE